MAAVTPVLAAVPCSALHASIRQHHLQVQGYMAKGYGLSRLKSSLGAIPGVETMNLDVRPVEDDECSVVSAFAANARIFATRSVLPVSSVIASARGPAMPMQQCPDASP